MDNFRGRTADNFRRDSNFFVPRLSQYAPETTMYNYSSAAALLKGSQGTLSDDTTDLIKGSSSVVLTSTSALEAHGDVKGLAFNLTGKKVVVYGQISNPSLLSSAGGYARIVLGTDDDFNFSNSWGFNLSNLKLNASQLTDAAGVWFRLVYDWSEGTAVAGTVNRASIKSLRIQMDDNNNGISMKINSVCFIDEPSAGMVTFTFDDGRLSQYTEARKKMDQYGYRGVLYAMPAAMGASGYLTLDQVKHLQEIGWDIGCHFATNLTTVPGSSVYGILLNIQRYFAANGLKAYNHFAYPNGAWDKTYVLPAVKKLFTTARSVAGNFPENYPPSDPYKLRVFSVLNTTTTAEIATAVDNARVNKEWLILVFHDIVASATNLTDFSIDNFGIVVDDIHADGIAVKTLTEVTGI